MLEPSQEPVIAQAAFPDYLTFTFKDLKRVLEPTAQVLRVAKLALSDCVRGGAGELEALRLPEAQRIAAHLGQDLSQFPPKEAQQLLAARLYYLEGYSSAPIGDLFGKEPPEASAYLSSVTYGLLDSLALQADTGLSLLNQFRAEAIISPWREWYQSLDQWVHRGADAPKSFRFDFLKTQRGIEMPIVFGALNLPFKEIANLVPAGSLHCERYPRNVLRNSSSREPLQGYACSIRDPAGTERFLFLIADAYHQMLVPRSENFRYLDGARGNFTKLANGEGPADVLAAFSPRPVKQQVRPSRGQDQPDKYLDLISVRSDLGRPGLHQVVPYAYAGSYVGPYIPISQIRAGQVIERFELFAANAERSSKDAPIAEYRLTPHPSGRGYQFHMLQTNGMLARWENLTARRQLVGQATRWLDGELPLLEGPQLGEFRIRRASARSQASPAGESPDLIASGGHVSERAQPMHGAISFNRQNIYVSMQHTSTSHLKGWLFFTNGNLPPADAPTQVSIQLSDTSFQAGSKSATFRYLGFWPPNSNPQESPPAVVVYRENGKTRRLSEKALVSLVARIYQSGGAPKLRHF
jgi:hypothetical protein